MWTASERSTERFRPRETGGRERETHTSRDSHRERQPLQWLGKPALTAGPGAGLSCWDPQSVLASAPGWNGPMQVCSNRIHFMKNLQLINGICWKDLLSFLGNGSKSYVLLLFWEKGVYVKEWPCVSSKRKPQTFPSSDRVCLLQLATLCVDVFRMSAAIPFPLGFWITPQGKCNFLVCELFMSSSKYILNNSLGDDFQKSHPLCRLFKNPLLNFPLSVEGANNIDTGAFSLQYFVLCFIITVMFTIYWTSALARCLTESTKFNPSHTLQKMWLFPFHR